jgi:hypothetical protein
MALSIENNVLMLNQELCQKDILERWERKFKIIMYYSKLRKKRQAENRAEKTRGGKKIQEGENKCQLLVFGWCQIKGKSEYRSTKFETNHERLFDTVRRRQGYGVTSPPLAEHG